MILYYYTLDTVSKATTNENYHFSYHISFYINLNMLLSKMQKSHITTSKITVIYSIHLSL